MLKKLLNYLFRIALTISGFYRRPLKVGIDTLMLFGVRSLSQCYVVPLHRHTGSESARKHLYHEGERLYVIIIVRFRRTIFLTNCEHP